MNTMTPVGPSQRADVLGALPPEWPEDPRTAIRALLRDEKVVVLDDDPTGTQTVHDVPVLTEWSVELLRAELKREDRVCYLLTNSRSLPPTEAEAMGLEIGRQLREAARLAGRPCVVVSRSDSTLRGHFPGEVAAVARGLDEPVDGWLLVPFFLEGGRYTIDDVHYVADGELLIPAGQTEFARDASFGYRSSHLGEWVAEKTGGRISAAEVASISLNDIRQGGPESVSRRLLDLAGGGSALSTRRVCAMSTSLCRGSLRLNVRGGAFCTARRRRSWRHGQPSSRERC